MDLKILNYCYYNNYNTDNPEYNGPILVLKCRDRSNKPHIVKICDQEVLKPEFYVPADETETALNIQRIWPVLVGSSPDSIWDEKTVKIETHFPWQVKQIRKHFTHTYQADVKWEKLAVQKLGLKTPYIAVPSDYKFMWLKATDIHTLPPESHFPVDVRVCYWDIETDMRPVEPEFGGWKDAELCPITLIGAFDNYLKEYHSFMWHPKNVQKKVYAPKNHDGCLVFYHDFPNEREMLIGYFNWFAECNFDAQFGFNSEGGYRLRSFKGKSRKRWFDGYDMPFLYKRAEVLGLLKEIQIMSPVPNVKEFNRYYGVYFRRYGEKNQVEMRGLAQLDFIPIESVFKYEDKFYKFKGYGLDNYMQFFLGFGKVEHEKQLWELWEDNPEKLRHYNLIDVEGTYKLDEKFGLSKGVFGLSEVVVAPAEDALLGSKLHDHDTLREYRGKIVFDTKYQKDFKRVGKTGKKFISKRFHLTLEDLKDRYSGEIPKSLLELKKRGGFVAKPIAKGIYDNVGTLDFSKFYPEAIMASNSGIRTTIDLDKEYDSYIKDKQGRNWDRKDIIETPCAYFRKDIDSINKTKFKKWIKERERLQKLAEDFLKKSKDTNSDTWKVIDARQYSLKPFTNIGFGVFGLPSDRNYSKLSFNACTLMCQDILKFVIHFCEKWLKLKVIGGDTDSVFIELKSKLLEDQIEELHDYAADINEDLNDYLNDVYNIQEHNIKIKPENIADKFFVHEKKHYVKRNIWKDGVILEKPDLDIKGLMLKKRSSSFIGQDLQLKLLDVLIEEPKVKEGFKRVIKEFDKKIEKEPWSYICPRGAINKRLSDYPETNQARRGAENAIKHLQKHFQPGDNPFLGVFNIGTLSFDEGDEETLKEMGFRLDYSELRRSQLQLKAEPFLELLGLNYRQIIAQSKQRGFFNV